MYELMIVILVMLAVLLKVVEQGASILIMTTLIMGNLFVWTLLKIKDLYDTKATSYRIYQMILVGLSLFISPLIGTIALINQAFARNSKKTHMFILYLISIGMYTYHHQEIDIVFIVEQTLMLSIGLFIMSIYNLEIYQRTNIEELKDTTKAYRNRINQLRTFNEQVEYTARLQERNRIAQALHDQFGHTLTGNIMRLEVVKILVDENQEKSKILIDEIITSLREGMDDIRKILKTLKPPQSEIGIHTIKEILQVLENERVYQTNLIWEGQLSTLSIHIWQVIRDNLIEAITNLKKHSNGNCFEVCINQYNQILKVEFRDNGRLKEVLNKGMGLRGMEERVVESGGKIYWDTEEGFRITMVWVDTYDKNNNC